MSQFVDALVRGQSVVPASALWQTVANIGQNVRFGEIGMMSVLAQKLHPYPRLTSVKFPNFN
jgi:hypothetical protein